MKLFQNLAKAMLVATFALTLQAKPKEVTSLADFDAILAKNKLVIVKFWMNGCPPCNAMKPHYEKVSADADLKNVTFLSVKGPSEVSDEYGITGFPTVLYFKNGKKLCKGNARTTPELKKEIKSKFGL